MARDGLAAHACDEFAITEMLGARPAQAALTSAAAFPVGAALPLAAVVVTSLIGLGVPGAVSARGGGAGMVNAATRVVFGGAGNDCHRRDRCRLRGRGSMQEPARCRPGTRAAVHTHATSSRERGCRAMGRVRGRPATGGCTGLAFAENGGISTWCLATAEKMMEGVNSRRASIETRSRRMGNETFAGVFAIAPGSVDAE